MVAIHLGTGSRIIRWARALSVSVVLVASGCSTSAATPTGAGGHPTFHVGIDAVAVLACAALVAWRRNLFLGLLVAVVVAAVARALGAG